MKPLILESDEVKADFDKVKEYILKNPNDIRYASDDLRNNEKLAMIAFDSDPLVYEFLGDDIKKNPSVAMRLIKNNKSMYRHLPDSLKKNEVFTSSIIDYDPSCIITMLDEHWKSNRNIMEKVIFAEPRFYNLSASEELNKSEEFALKVIEKDFMYLFFVPEEIKSNLEFKEKIFDKAPTDSLYLVVGDVKDNAMIDRALNKNPYCFPMIHKDMKTRERTLNYIVKCNLIQGVEKENFKDKEFWKDVFFNLEQNAEDKKDVINSFRLSLTDKNEKEAFKIGLKEYTNMVKGFSKHINNLW